MIALISPRSSPLALTTLSPISESASMMYGPGPSARLGSAPMIFAPPALEPRVDEVVVVRVAMKPPEEDACCTLTVAITVGALAEARCRKDCRYRGGRVRPLRDLPPNSAL